MKRLFLFIVLFSSPLITLAQSQNQVTGAMLIQTTETRTIKSSADIEKERLQAAREKAIQDSIAKANRAMADSIAKANRAIADSIASAKRKLARNERAANRKGRFFLSFNLAMAYPKYPDALSYGFMAGWGSNKVLGGYVKGLFGDGISSTNGSITSQGSCLGYTNYDSKAKAEASYNAVTGGLLFRMGCPLNLYVGAGASWRQVGHRSATDGQLYLSADKSTTNVCLDFGLMLRFKWFNISGGAIYTPKCGFASNMGVGICF